MARNSKHDDPDSGDATQRQVISIASYLLFVVAIAVWLLYQQWPSCTGASNNESLNDLKISAVIPAYGRANEETTVSILGSGFKETARAKFGDNAANVEFVDSTRLIVHVPSRSVPQGGEVVSVLVTNSDNRSSLLSRGFLYVSTSGAVPPPVINSVSPGSGPVMGGQLVTIKGSGFKNVTTVSFGGVPSAYSQVLNDSQLVASTPPHDEGKVDVAVATVETAVRPDGYAYTCWLIMPTTLYLMACLAGALGGSVHALRSLTYHVGNKTLQQSALLKYITLPVLGASIAIIFFIATSAGFYTLEGSGAQILIGLSGLVGMFSEQAAVKLKNIAEGLLAVPQDREMPAQLLIREITPTSGPDKGGTFVTLIGQGFDVESVRFDGGEAKLIKQSPTSIEVETPAHQAGKVDVLVINTSGLSYIKHSGYEYVADSGSDASHSM